MASPITYPTIEDKDLDDAALWAVIDSATASHSSIKSKSLALRSPNFHSPNFKPSHSPQSNLTKSPRTSYCTVSNASGVSRDGEVVHEPWVYRPPRKVARNCPSEVSESSPLAVVRNQQRTPPIVKVHHSSPEEYLSPEIGKFSVKEVSNCSEVSPRSFGWSEGKDIVKQDSVSSLPSVSFFKGYQNSAMEILEKTDYTMISGNPFIKKSGWRKLSCYFNVSYEIRDKNIEFDDSRNVQRAEFIVRAHMQSGRFSDGWGSCDRREKRFSKPNHDIPSTAETRAKNKACQDLLGIGEYRPGGSQAMRS